jgi:PIN domain nuclease of toxin-antitoxin system
MKVLLDTHVFLWWIMGDPRLPANVFDFISDGNNELFFSAASCWEIAIKAQLGRVEITNELEDFIPDQMVKNAVQGLAIYLSHALHVYNLPNHHRDPFDRMLVAQAQIEKIPIVTSDPFITKYDVPVLWDIK